jgi:hypothetical protein
MWAPSGSPGKGEWIHGFASEGVAKAITRGTPSIILQALLHDASAKRLLDLRSIAAENGDKDFV